VSVSPADGAKGVAGNAVIVVKFSKAMNRRSVELAYESMALPANAVVFAWSKDGSTDRDILTVSPINQLVYAKGDSVNSAAQSYAFTIRSTALDAWGSQINTFVWGFTTLRDLSIPCLVQANLSGSAQANGTLSDPSLLISSLRAISFQSPGDYIVTRSGITFDCAQPFNLNVNVVSAVLTAYKKTVNSWGPPDGALYLHSVSFSDLTGMYRACGQSQGIRFSESSAIGFRMADVTTWVRSDFAGRVERTNKSQLCLRFSEPNNSNVEFSSPAEAMAPSLKVSVLAP